MDVSITAMYAFAEPAGPHKMTHKCGAGILPPVSRNVSPGSGMPAYANSEAA
jgi:hypothetical protein